MTTAPNTLPQLVARFEQSFGDTRALFDPHAKPIEEITYKELADRVKQLGAGLLSCGIGKGEHVALFSDNCPRWIISDLAITGIGAVDVPRGTDTADSEFNFILSHSGAVAAFVQNKRLYERLSKLEAFNALRLIVIMDDSMPATVPDGKSIRSFSEVLEQSNNSGDDFQRASSQVEASTLATIVYTSGTTGSPKGVMLTHGNLMTQPTMVDLGMQPNPGEIQLSILPSWHAYERATEYYGLYHGTTITYSDKRYIRDDLLKLCPHLLPCVPRIWEMVYKGIHVKVAAAPEKRQRIFRTFIDVGHRFVRARRTANGLNASREPVGKLARSLAAMEMTALYPMYRLGDKLVFSKLRQATGGRLRAAVSGGGSLAPYLDDFFEVVGIPILNGYGLTESSPVLTLRSLRRNVRGTVGLPVGPTEISIKNELGEQVKQGESGEIWARGPQLMTGYYNNPDATSAVLKEDGWFLTGDLGYRTSAGDLVISGRAKDTIVLSSGENVEPEPIEDACRQSRLVQQIVLVGQDQKTLGALVVPEFSLLAEKLGLTAEAEPSEIVSHPEAAKTVKQELATSMKASGGFKDSEAITKVHLIDKPFSESDGTMTQTMKIKRNVVNQRFQKEIDALYS